MPLVSSPPFPLFWNVGESQAPPIDVTQFDFSPRNYTQVGNQCSNPSTNCSSWTQGVFPSISDKGIKINGGVPQAGDLALHLQMFKEGVTTWIPDVNWNGNAVLDFEAWTTVWELNNHPDNWHGARYQNESLRIVQQTHPEYNQTQLEAAAKQEFETAATEWFVKSLELGRQLRPLAKWGFYGLPSNELDLCSSNNNESTVECSYDGPNGVVLKEYAARQSPIWAASDALFPSIYYPDALVGYPRNATGYVKAVVAECVRLVAKSNKPVYAYGWHAYHSGNQLIPVDEIINMYKVTKESGGEGVVLWGPTHWNVSLDYWQQLSQTIGPASKEWCEQQRKDKLGGCVLGEE